MMQLSGLRIFLRVAELLSFSRAAEALGLPKATVSVAVRDLEAALGTQLLHRTTRQVRLTHDGAQFQERARALLEDAEELETLFQTRPEAISGRLRVNMPVNMARQTFLPVLPEFLDRHPALEFELGASDRAVDLIREGYDCVIRVGGSLEPGLVARNLGALEVITCASPAYLAQHGIPEVPEDLARHRMVRYAPRFGLAVERFEFRDGDGFREVALPGTLTVDNTQAYSAAAVAGVGLIQAPRIGVMEEIARGRLVALPDRWQAAPMPVAILFPERRHLPRRVRAFIDWAGRVLGPHMV